MKVHQINSQQPMPAPTSPEDIVVVRVHDACGLRFWRFTWVGPHWKDGGRCFDSAKQAINWKGTEI